MPAAAGVPEAAFSFEKNPVSDEATEEKTVESNIDSTQITDIPLEQIQPFASHPFRIYDGERLDDMVESIRQNGILQPVIVRRIQDSTYEMLSGHNRLNAARIAGLKSIPALIKENITDDEALMYVVETNVMQRSFSEMLPSEKAAVLSLRYSKMFSQGKRNDILNELKNLENPHNNQTNETSSPVETKLRSDLVLGDEYGLSRAAVARLLRIDKLHPMLKADVDKKRISIRAGVELSYLNGNTEQLLLADIITANPQYKLDYKRAQLLRAKSGELDEDLIREILSGAENVTKTAKPFKVKPKIIKRFFRPDSSQAEIEKTITKALELYFQREKEESNAET